MVRAPTPHEEDRGLICPDRKILTAERVEHVNRIKGLLFAQGVSDYEPLLRKRRARLEELRTGDGRPLPEHLKAQIGRELDRLELTLQQIKSVETERDAMLSSPDEGTPAPGAMLKSLKGIGPEFAGVLWSEGLFRSFSNRRQVASYAGLAPTPWRSGSVAHEQGVSKAGNPNHDPTRLVVGKASAPFDTDPVVSSTRTAQWWPSSESTDRCLGAKAADRLLEICDCRGCLGRSRDNGRLKTKAFSLPTFRGLISSGGSR